MVGGYANFIELKHQINKIQLFIAVSRNGSKGSHSSQLFDALIFPNNQK